MTDAPDYEVTDEMVTAAAKIATGHIVATCCFKTGGEGGGTTQCHCREMATDMIRAALAVSPLLAHGRSDMCDHKHEKITGETLKGWGQRNPDAPRSSPMTNIVERLRELADYDWTLIQDAAAEIQHLRARVKELEAENEELRELAFS